VAIVPAGASSAGDADPVATVGAPSSEQVSLSGAPALLTTEHKADGRTVLTLTVPAISAQVVASGPDAALLLSVLRTTRVVSVDSVGCTRELPASPTWDKAAARPAVRVGTPTSVTVCLYEDQVLGASAELTGAQARSLAAALTAAKPGPVPDQ